MTKKEAVKILISEFHNSVIAKDWIDLDEVELDMVKALKLFPSVPDIGGKRAESRGTT